MATQKASNHPPSATGILWPAVPVGRDRGKTIRALIGQFEESERWPLDKIRDHQFRQLGTLLAHAVETVPHYRRRFAGSAAADFEHLTPAAWAALPLLTREDIQAAGDSLHSRRVPGDHGRVTAVHTSGTTGRPVRVLRTEIMGLFWSAFTLRDHLWHGRDLKGKLAAMRHSGKGVDPYPNGTRSSTWGPSSMVFATGPAVALNINCPTAQQAEWLARENPHYLLTHPTVVYRLARYCLQNGIRVSNLKQVLTLSEVVRPEVREACRAAWEVGIADNYTGRDVGYLALQCPEFDHYHVQAEGALVEIIDDAGKPAPPGAVGRVVVTPLHNFAMPLIRYEIGDHAEAGEPCPCGRTLPVIRRILGREQDMVELPSGERRWTLLSTGNIESFLKLAPIRQYQFVQKDLSTIELRLATGRALTAEEKNSLKDWVRDKLDHPFEVTFTFVDRIPRTASGKYRDFIKEMD